MQRLQVANSQALNIGVLTAEHERLIHEIREAKEVVVWRLADPQRPALEKDAADAIDKGRASKASGAASRLRVKTAGKGRPTSYNDGVDATRVRQFIETQPKGRHTIRQAIEDQVPEGIPSWASGANNPRYGRVAQLVRRVRRNIERETGKKFVRVPRGEPTEVMLKA